MTGTPSAALLLIRWRLGGDDITQEADRVDRRPVLGEVWTGERVSGWRWLGGQ